MTKKRLKMRQRASSVILLLKRHGEAYYKQTEIYEVTKNRESNAQSLAS